MCVCCVLRRVRISKERRGEEREREEMRNTFVRRRQKLRSDFLEEGCDESAVDRKAEGHYTRKAHAEKEDQ